MTTIIHITDPAARRGQPKIGEIMNEKLIRLPQVKSMIGLCTASIYEKMKKGDFPKPIKIGRLSAWVESEVQDWISKQIRASRMEDEK